MIAFCANFVEPDAALHVRWPLGEKAIHDASKGCCIYANKYFTDTGICAQLLNHFGIRLQFGVQEPSNISRVDFNPSKVDRMFERYVNEKHQIEAAESEGGIVMWQWPESV